MTSQQNREREVKTSATTAMVARCHRIANAQMTDSNQWSQNHTYFGLLNVWYLFMFVYGDLKHYLVEQFLIVALVNV